MGTYETPGSMVHLGRGTPPRRAEGPPRSGRPFVCVDRSELGGAATRGGDLVPGGTGERVGADLQRHRDLAVAQDLDRVTGPDRADGDEVCHLHRTTLREEGAQLV